MSICVHRPLLLAGVLAVLPFFANAADKLTEPVDVNVINPVVQVEVSNANPVPVSGVVTSADNPALAPVSLKGEFNFAAINNQVLLTTVPAGKRLVIDHVSYYSGGPDTGELIFLSLRTGEFGPMILFAEINPPHASATPGFSLQDASHPAKAFFEAGQEVWLSASRSNGSARNLTAVFTGHYVTL